MKKRDVVRDPSVAPRPASRPFMRRAPVWLALSGAIALVLVLAIYILRMDHVVGMFVDDAWYALLGQSIATGQGYRLINSPVPGILPLYPPAYPFLLSLVFRAAPEFPANLPWLKAVSIASMVGVWAVTWWYYARVRRLTPYFGLAVATATALVPPFVFITASSLLSEPVFTLFLVLAVAVIERGTQAEIGRWAWAYALIGGAAASFAFLTRSIAIALIIGALGYLGWRRLWRSALIFAATVALIVGPWMIYTAAHAPTPEQQREHGGHIVQPYTRQFWQRRAGDVGSGEIGIGELPDRVWHNVGTMLMRDAGEISAAKLHYSLQEGGGGQAGVSLIIALFAIGGFIAVARERLTLAEIVVPLTLGVVALWPWETFRFVLPLAPFIIFYLLVGLRLIYDLHLRLQQEQRRPVWNGLAVVAGLLVALNAYGNLSFIYRTQRGTTPGLLTRAFDENKVALDWMKTRLPAGSVIASNNPALIYLYTGHRTIASDKPAENWDIWNRLNVRYMAPLSPIPLTPPDLAERRFTTIYQPKSELNLRVVDLGPPQARQRWGAIPKPQFRNFN